MINLKQEMSNIVYYQTVIEESEDKRKEVVFDEDFSKVKEFIFNDEFKWSIPRRVSIPKSTPGKFRDIFIFDDKESFYLKVINEILFSKCSKYLSPVVYSYRKGVKCLDAAKVVNKYLKDGNCYGAKVDISNYFMNVNRKTITNYIEELIEDEWGRILLNKLFDIHNCYFKDDIENKYLGIMPGCAVSAFFANICLKSVDYFLIKETKCCCRYGDDIVFFCEDMYNVEKVLISLQNKLENLGLSFNKDKVVKYDNPDKVEFLGLEINKNYIDISDKTFNKYKLLIKRVCNKYGKSISLSPKLKDDLISKCISSINNIFFRQGVLLDLKGDRARFMFGNVTTFNKLKQLDFYLRDRLRQAYTGSNNSANINKLSEENLKNLGYHSFGEMYNLWKLGKDVYNSETYKLNEDLHSPKFVGYCFNCKSDKVDSTMNFNNFIKFYSYCAKHYCSFILEGKEYKFCSMSFDVYSQIIKIGSIDICYENKLLFDNFIVKTRDSEIVNCKILNTLVSDYFKLDDKLLLSLYLNSSLKKSLYPIDNQVIYPKWFRSYRFEDLYEVFGDKLKLDIPYQVRESYFYCYLYLLLCNGDLIRLFRGKDKFAILKFQDFSLVIKRDLVESYKTLKNDSISEMNLF